MVIVVNKRKSSGFTIMELMVALSLTAIVIGTVYFTWNFINLHIAKHTGSALSSDEGNRIAQSISSQIRRSPAVLKFNEHSIIFLSSQGTDTTNWDFNGKELLHNGIALPLITKGNRISSFTVRDLNDSNVHENSVHLLLLISLGITNNNGDSLKINHIVKAIKNASDNNQFGDDTFW